MQVILLERIGRLGQMGDVVTVKDGFARRGLAVRMDRVLKVDADEISARRDRPRKALGLLAGNEQHRTGCTGESLHRGSLKCTDIISNRCHQGNGGCDEIRAVNATREPGKSAGRAAGGKAGRGGEADAGGQPRYLQIARADPVRCRVIDAEGTPDAVEERVRKAVRERFAPDFPGKAQ